MRLLVCGARDWKDRRRLERELDEINQRFRVTVVIEGEAPGADTMAREWAESRGIPVEPYPADWNRHGKAAGPIRNQQMLDEGKPDLVVGFPLPHSKGTYDMLKRAVRANIPTVVR